MRNELPTQADILEELADRVALQIEQGKPVAFESALGELVRYHRFLLSLNASTTPDGEAFSYAELSGALWHGAHHEWLRHYRRLFTLAAARISDQQDFLIRLAHVPSQLLRLPDGLQLSDGVKEGIFGLMPMLMHTIEVWVSRRSGVVETNGSPSTLRLSASEAREYSIALKGVIGAWEALLSHAPELSGLDERAGRSEAERWKAFCRAWKVLWLHLRNTSYCVAVAVWNEDEEGARGFRESLVRWVEINRYRLAAPLFMRLPELLFPTVLDLPWEEARAVVEGLGYGRGPDVRPEDTLGSIVSSVHADVIMATSSVLTHWTIVGKRTSPLAIQTARSLLAGEGADTYGPVDTVSAAQRLMVLIRMQLAGERFEKGGYGSQLDGLVERLDMMTERDVVPGRIFEPTTLHERGELLAANVAILAAAMDGSTTQRDRIDELVKSEAVLPKRDGSLRDVLHELKRYRETIDARSDALLAATGALGAQDSAAALDGLAGVVGSVEETIEAARHERLASAEIDAARLAAFAKAAEDALLGSSDGRFFAAASVRRAAAIEGPVPRALYFGGYSKAYLVDPPMTQLPSNEVASKATVVSRHADAMTVQAFAHLEKTPTLFDFDPLDDRFWEAVGTLAAKVGEEPRVMVPAAYRMPILETQFRQSAHLREVEITRRQGLNKRYMLTIAGIDVYCGFTDQDGAWLFSGRKLVGIEYGRLEGGGCVGVAYVAEGGDPMATSGDLEFSFLQHLHWSESPVFDITFRGEQPRQGDSEE